MRLAVFDTNVIVSAGIKPGSVPFRLLHAHVFESQIKLVLCPAIAAEYREVCTRSRFAQFGFPPAWLEILMEDALLLPDPPSWPSPLPDPDDGLFLALAKVSGAWLVTGNLRHYPAESRSGVTVCSPAEYLALLEHS